MTEPLFSARYMGWATAALFAAAAAFLGYGLWAGETGLAIASVIPAGWGLLYLAGLGMAWDMEEQDRRREERLEAAHQKRLRQIRGEL